MSVELASALAGERRCWNRLDASSRGGMPHAIEWFRIARWWGGVVAFAVVAMIASSAQANVPLTQISSDPFGNPNSQHATEVEPSASAFGSMIVTVVQAGRFLNGAASGIAFATSTDAGATWTRGVLPMTTYSGGPYDRASDPVVAYDARHRVWLASVLPIVETQLPDTHVPPGAPAIVVSRSSDGISWSGPIGVAPGPAHGYLDKPWIACDNSPTSPFYGNCYEQWTDVSTGSRVELSTSNDGGRTWGSVRTPASGSNGWGVNPVVQPNGTVIVPITSSGSTYSLRAFRSLDGGASWSKITNVDPIRLHTVAGMRPDEVWPSAATDGGGSAYVVWWDCRFRIKCASNDIVFTSSANGVDWSPVARIPIDPVTSPVDHFIAALGIDPATSGAGAHVGLTYYSEPNASCDPTTCQLDVGFVSSANGGATWSAPTQLAGPMSISWLANTTKGRFVGEYIATTFTSDGLAHGIVPLAAAPSAGLFDEATYTPTGGLVTTGGTTPSSANGVVVTNATTKAYKPEP